MQSTPSRSLIFDGVQCPITPPLDTGFDDDKCASDAAVDFPPLGASASEPLVAVIGVGYVGTHLVEVFSRRYHTMGFDVSSKRIQDLEPTFSNHRERVGLTSNPLDLASVTHFLISVPTLLLPDNSVDTSYIRSALKTIETHARPGSTVVIESSVAIGMTRELLGPLAQRCGFYAGMSPEVSWTVHLAEPVLGDFATLPLFQCMHALGTANLCLFP